MNESVLIADAPEELSSTAARRFTFGPESGPRLSISRRDLVIGGLAALVAAGAVTVALLALDDGAERQSSAARSSASVTEPSPSATRPSSGELADAPGAPADETGRRTPVDAVEEDRGTDGGPSSPTVPLLGVVAAVLAAGALETWRRQRARPPAEPPLERVPRAGPRLDVDGESPPGRTDARLAGRLGAALVHLAGNVRGCGQPRVVQVGDDRIDIMLSEPDPSPPSPWRPEASGWFWVLGVHTALPAIHDEAFPLPALVTVGTGESHVLVDVEAYGVVALVGDEDACRNVARAMVTELSTRAEGLVTVEVVGDLRVDATARLNGVDRHGSWDDVDTGIIGTSARLLDSGGWPHTWAARASGRIYDGWAPTVWFTEASQASRYRDALEAISSQPGAGSAMVVVGDDPGCGLRIHLDDEGDFEIPDLNLSGTARTLTTEVAGSAS